ncbi:putative glucuronosyltransferase, partial [Tetrabaena socialis]
PMGRIPAPDGSPPGTPPVRRGRPLVTQHSAPKTTWDGAKSFGEVPYDNVYGPQGYCNVTDPPWQPGCGMDGLSGRNCDEVVESFCPGACSGHGTCYLGWCKWVASCGDWNAWGQSDVRPTGSRVRVVPPPPRLSAPRSIEAGELWPPCRPVAWRPAPRGDRECPGGCNNVGRCNYDTGLCDCPAGWAGPGCRTPFKRPCTLSQRVWTEHRTEPHSHIGPDKRDLDWTNIPQDALYSRCGGICDDDTAICYCDGPMGRVPAPKGSPPGTPPRRRGRPLVTLHSAPKTTWDGRRAFGEVEYDLVYGPKGYCNVTNPPWQPDCNMDGLSGRNCDEVVENFCPGACSGHGTCYLGWCNCEPGYYGHDCARRRAGLPLLPSTIPTTPWLAELLREPPAAQEPPPAPTRRRPLIYVYDLEPLYQAKILQYSCEPGYYGHDCARRRAGLPLLPSTIPTTPWLAELLREPPAAQEPPPAPTRRRPLIYVYDLEPLYQAKILQYRVSPPWCVHRNHVPPRNSTEWTDVWVYAADTLLHESLLLSEHRTFDPEEADFYYIPHAASCLPFPIGSWADAPWFPEPGGPRVMQMANMLRDALAWVNATFPYWARRGGRDHLLLFTHDEGACWAPTVAKDAIWLTHWGRLGDNHTSNTAYAPDRYNTDFRSALQPEGFVKFIAGHPCYDPSKDLLVPAFKQPRHYAASPLQGAPARERDLLFFFRGDVGKHRLPNYSRGVRQQIYALARDGDWAAKHRFLIGDGDDVPGSYTEQLSRAVFCLVAPGDGWSARMEDAVLHGCIPVIVADDVHAVFEGALDVDSFALRLPQAEVPRILEVLRSVPEKVVRAKQARLGRVWHRYRYASLPGLSAELRRAQAANAAMAPPPPAPAPEGSTAAAAAAAPPQWLPRPYDGDPAEDDAFATILQWLHSRIPHTR